MYKEKCQSKLIENSLNLVYLSEAYNNISLCKMSVSACDCIGVCVCLCAYLIWIRCCNRVLPLLLWYKVFAVELTR